MDELLEAIHSQLRIHHVQGMEYRIGFVKAEERLPPTIPLIVSEVAHHIRAALDSLVYDLAVEGRKASGQTYADPTGTQFPIESDPKTFEGRVTGRIGKQRCARHLAWVQPEWVNYIRSVQPFKGCLWTALLQQVSNQDKHRFLSEFSLHLEMKFASPVEGQDEIEVDQTLVVFLRPYLLPVPEVLHALHQEASAFVQRIEVEATTA